MLFLFYFILKIINNKNKIYSYRNNFDIDKIIHIGFDIKKYSNNSNDINDINRLIYSGYDMRKIMYNIDDINDKSTLINIQDIFYKKNILDTLLNKDIDIINKINLIELNRDTYLKTNILNGDLYKDWNFDF